jgi:hypothetical protein
MFQVLNNVMCTDCVFRPGLLVIAEVKYGRKWWTVVAAAWCDGEAELNPVITHAYPTVFVFVDLTKSDARLVEFGHVERTP